MLQMVGIQKKPFKGWQQNEDVFKQMAREAIRRGRASFQNCIKVSGSGFKTKYPELDKHMNNWWAWWALHKVQNKKRDTFCRSMHASLLFRIYTRDMWNLDEVP